MKIKSFLLIILLFIISFVLISCAETIPGDIREVNVVVTSENDYTEDDLMSAISTIEENFVEHFRGCKMIEIRYAASYSLETMNSRASDFGFKDGIIFFMDFSTGERGVVQEWSHNTEYTDYEWLLVRNSNDEKWQIEWKGCGYS